MDSTNDGFVWQGEDMSGIPRLYLLDGSVCEPFLRFFAHGRLTRFFKAKSSMRPSAYSLRDWWCHLHLAKVNWEDVDDTHLRRFREILKMRVRLGQMSLAHVDTKIRHVFEFYANIPAAMPYFSRGKQMTVFVGEPNDECARITSKTAGKRVIWSGSDKVKSAKVKRPTPDDLDVSRLLETLRAKSLLPYDNSWMSRLRQCEAERNWLVARAEAEAGLRRMEVAELSLWEIGIALSKLRIVQMPKALVPHLNPLSIAAHDDTAKQQIRDGIDKLKVRGYLTINTVVSTKGGGGRAVEFPLDLISDILEIGIWSVRHLLFCKWSAQKSNVTIDHDAIFLSSKTRGSKLTVGAVGDIIKEALGDLDIPGSGHRLRAFYLTNMAWLLWNQNLALSGYRGDIAVTNQTLNRLAELAGHKEPGTTERHYLDMALLLHHSERNRPRLTAASETMNALIRASPGLSTENLRRLERIINALGRPTEPLFLAMLDEVLKCYSGGSNTNPPTKPRPDLRVV
ncbi:hypothetical protein ELH99_17600 [Rhizobium leguminosarum]|nr:hypothetical protein ELH99_17600 [Rhizobium leguminosarum]TBB50210.1 hypothetical protein ELH46_16185 [Rhizobium ruizarguesonis]